MAKPIGLILGLAFGAFVVFAAIAIADGMHTDMWRF